MKRSRYSTWKPLSSPLMDFALLQLLAKSACDKNASKNDQRRSKYSRAPFCAFSRQLTFSFCRPRGEGNWEQLHAKLHTCTWGADASANLDHGNVFCLLVEKLVMLNVDQPVSWHRTTSERGLLLEKNQLIQSQETWRSSQLLDFSLLCEWADYHTER